MERRTFATFAKQWPEEEPNFLVTFPPCTLEEYLKTNPTPKNEVLLMFGDLQRIKLYPEKGFQIHQEIPAPIWSHFEFLVQQGFTAHLIKP
jgi:hypothetical protein